MTNLIRGRTVLRRVNLTLLLALLGGSAAYADSFDVATFTAPKGWKKETRADRAVRFSRVTGAKYCLIDLYASAPSQGSLSADFEREWADLVGTPLKANAPELQKGDTKDGWQNQLGGAGYEFESGQGLALLSTYSGFNKRLSVLLLTNDEKCLTDLDTFLGSLKLQKPAGTTNPPSKPTSPTGTQTGTPTVQSTGFKFSTTKFDDGWVSTQQKDWVEVRKGPATVRLHYAVPYTDQTRNLDENARVAYFWNALVQGRYAAQNINVAPHESGIGVPYFGEADATEVATGKRVHVALMILSENGSARCIEIVTPDQTTLSGQFPNYDRIRAMQAYNKFQVDLSDLPGIWENSSSAYGMYYSTVDGSFAGMRGASVYDKFTFNPAGTYVYEYVGVSGQGGAQAVAQGKRSGKFKLTPWGLTATDSAGKTDTYSAQFEAIRGGRILHLQNTKFSGLKYALVKRK